MSERRGRPWPPRVTARSRAFLVPTCCQGTTGSSGVLKPLKALRLLRFLKLGRLLKFNKILHSLDRDTLDQIEDFFQQVKECAP